MAAIDLPAIVRASGKRSNITVRPIEPTRAQAIDLAAIIAPAWRIWGQSIDLILAGYNPRPISDSLTRDDANQIQTAIDAVAAQFSTILITEITPALRRWTTRVERWHQSRWAGAVKAATSVDLSAILTAQPVAETVEAFVARNVALAKNISDQAQSRIADAVFRGYQNRTPAREVAKEIREATAMGRDRAVRIAADQNSKLAGALDTERMAEAGLDLWKYRHSGKLHPRSTHKARDGRIYTLRGNRQVNADGSPMAGGDVIAPGDEPAQPPWCGCRKQAYISLMAELD